MVYFSGKMCLEDWGSFVALYYEGKLDTPPAPSLSSKHQLVNDRFDDYMLVSMPYMDGIWEV